MFNKIKSWYYKRKKDKEINQWKNGFDWAAGTLLREEETPISIEAKYGYDDSPFDSGVYTAVQTLIELKIIKDDEGD